MGRWTIRLLRKLSPELRLVVAAYLFWISLFGSIIFTVFVSRTAWERILMFISWQAICLTCVDILLTADVRDTVE